jgi:glycosyltransferase involved in cell wall biosynthesis
LTQKLTGVQRYAIEVCRQIKKQSPNVVFIAPKNIIHTEIAEELEAKTVGSLTGHLWEQIELPIYLKRQGNPLLINLANTAPLYYKNKLSTIHDIAFERYAKSFSWKFRFAYQKMIPQLLKTSLHIITVSEFSKKEISEFYSIPTENISVIYNAVSEDFQPTNTNFEERFILAVSSLNYQKNFHSLIKAFNQLNLPDIKLYLIGDINKNFADHSLVKEIESNKNITFLGRVSDKELIEYYSGALGFVYPSFYEGFGIPPLEAQACGCPCVISNVASLPEVGDSSVLYCDPYNIHDIAEKINLIALDEDLRNRLTLKGYPNLQRFSWQSSASKLISTAEKYI